MPKDPYLYPSGNALKNRLGLRDSGAVVAVIDDHFNRTAPLPAATTAEAFKALHKGLLADLFDWAGQIRTTDLYLGDSRYARVDIIDAALDQCFSELNAQDIFADQPYDQFCETLAAHISTLNATAPFRIGNRRTLHLHAQSLAHHGGHGAAWPQMSTAAWARLLDENFLSLSNDDLVNALCGRLTSEDILCDLHIGVGGIALLPSRHPPAGKRYLTSLGKAKAMLEAHMCAARDEATLRLRALLSSGASQTAMLNARQERRYLLHPKGALFQLDLLEAVNAGKIRALLSDIQSSLERVREVAAAIGIAVTEQPAAQIESLSNQLYTPPCAAGISPHDERMARQFLTNLSTQNRADPRFVEAQRMVDAIMLIDLMTTGVDRKPENDSAANARQIVADRIRTGEIILIPIAEQIFHKTPFADAKRA
jgi:cell filamentation protein